MNTYTQTLTSVEFHRNIQDVLEAELWTLLQQNQLRDRILIQDEPLDHLAQSELVEQTLHQLLQRFRTNPNKLARWFHELDLSLQDPTVRGQLPITNLAFHLGGRNNTTRIDKLAVRCDFLPTHTVQKMIDNAKQYAGNPLPLSKPKIYTTRDVLVLYFEFHLLSRKNDYKQTCASYLKKLHHDVIQHLPLSPISACVSSFAEVRLDDEEISLDRLLQASKRWLDEFDRAECLSHSPPPSPASTPLASMDRFSLSPLPTSPVSSPLSLRKMPRVSDFF